MWAEAPKQIFGSAECIKKFLIVEIGHNQSDATGGCKTDKVNNGKSLVSTSTGTC